jgi:hypothetical protein
LKPIKWKNWFLKICFFEFSLHLCRYAPVKLWNGGKCAATMSGVHTGEVVGVSVHPTNAYACSIGGAVQVESS